ncbi:hypothetical protein M445_18335 [Vibrio owensii 47666-1]|uniref:hypothetical protein n=1 Tax=Vibrio owensii TaxID=696485 RepID=UPI000591B007|nr:hypothetical protein [Vibrio owensii]KIF46294.1 hypothetical protein M445_18335 [Vibrio owensii 47666-1]
MNKSILSVLITNALFSASAAADIYSGDAASAEQDFFASLVNGTGGHVGAFFEKEDKKSYDANGKLIGKNTYTENSLITGYLYNKELPLSLNYSLKEINDKWNPAAAGAHSQIKNSFQLATNLRYRRTLGNGFNTGLGWQTEIERGEKTVGATVGDITKDQHQFYAFLGYWNKGWKGGFYSQASYGLQDTTDDTNGSVWGEREQTYYKLMFKPYKNFGKVFAGVEFYYEDKDTDSAVSGDYLENFTEMYIEPELAYSFDFGGRLFVKQRYTEKTTKNKMNGREYFGTVNKTTLGYQHNINDWTVAAEVELFNEDKEQDVGSGKVDSGNEEYNKLKLIANYRF